MVVSSQQYILGVIFSVREVEWIVGLFCYIDISNLWLGYCSLTICSSEYEWIYTDSEATRVWNNVGMVTLFLCLFFLHLRTKFSFVHRHYSGTLFH